MFFLSPLSHLPPSFFYFLSLLLPSPFVFKDRLEGAHARKAATRTLWRVSVVNVLRNLPYGEAKTPKQTKPIVARIERQYL
jgi:hypothetical protein